jgi:hypothetical protein
VATAGNTATVNVRQDGRMPSPVMLGVRLAPGGPALRRAALGPPLRPEAGAAAPRVAQAGGICW